VPHAPSETKVLPDFNACVIVSIVLHFEIGKLRISAKKQ
jgi:hypothetical protein